MLTELHAHKQSPEINRGDCPAPFDLDQPTTPRVLHPGLDAKAPSRHQYLLYIEEPTLY